MATLSRFVDLDAAAAVALGDGHDLLLQAGYGRAGLNGGQGGRHAGGTGTHDHNVVLLGLGDVGDGFGRDQETGHVDDAGV